MATLARELPHFEMRLPVITPADRLGMTLFFAVVAHLILVLGVVFVPEDRANRRHSSLDIVLVQKKTERAPDRYEHLAQANHEGGGESDRAARPSTPLPAPVAGPIPTVTAASPAAEPAPPMPMSKPSAESAEPAESPEAPQPLIALADEQAGIRESRQEAPTPRKKPTPAPDAAHASAPAQTLNAASLISKSLSMASLSAEIDQRLQAYAERPRRKWISVRTREYKYAAYMEAWRVKVERIGNLNYPGEARRKKLSGHLLLEVVLNANGTVNDIILRRSSGHRVLDDAAIRIVKLAAPYSPLPDSILEDTDILHIERTWRFLSSNEFSGS